LWLPVNFRIVRRVTTKNTRCVVCGETVRGKSVRIAKGSIHGERWTERSLFGVAHEKCFALAVESPKLVLDELRRASHEQGSRSTTP
jgi:hypothetical protein